MIDYLVAWPNPIITLFLDRKLQDSASRNNLSELTALKGCKRFGRRDEISSAIADVKEDIARLVREFQVHEMLPYIALY